MSSLYDAKISDEKLFQQYLNSHYARTGKHLEPTQGRVLFNRQKEENSRLTTFVIEPEAEDEKVCKTCNELLPLSLFPDSSRIKGGKLRSCKNCRNIQARKIYARNKAKQESDAKKAELGLEIKKMIEAGKRQKDIAKELKLNSIAYYSAIEGLEINKPKFKIKPEKKCTKCGKTKKLKEYAIQKTARDGRASGCKECLARIKREKRKAKND